MSFNQNSKAVVFLDRDGTLNVEAGYLRNTSDLILIDGAASAVRKLNEAGVAAILVTNQSGPARDFYPEKHIHDLHERLKELLSKDKAHLDDIYYCPHLPDGSVPEFVKVCNCRKPQVGMVERAFSEHPELSRHKAFVVGDKATDVELARNCRAKAVLVKTGYGQSVLDGTYQWVVEPDYEAETIVQAIDWILSSLKDAKAGL
jgi:D-glycero-D-manno-heptose 1,7-bisphosphate phosphatase